MGCAARSAWITRVVAGIIVLSVHSAVAQEPFDPNRFFNSQDRNAIVHLTINGRTASGAVGSNNGTAFFISHEGFALTTAHLFYRDRDINKSENLFKDASKDKTFIEGRIGSVSESPKTFQLVNIYPENDVALIQQRDPLPGIVSLKVCARKPGVGEKLYAFGFTAGENLNPQHGEIGGALINDRYPVSISINPGMSGGPVIDKSGKVFAMAASGPSEPDYQRYNFVRSVQFFGAALQAAKVTEDCDAAEGSRKGDPLLVYISFLETDPNTRVKLAQYREHLQAEFFRLSQVTSLTPIFNQSHQQIDSVENLFKAYFDGPADRTIVNTVLSKIQILDESNPNPQFIYLLRLQDLNTYIKASPVLFQVRFETKPVLVKHWPLAPQTEPLNDFVGTVRTHVRSLFRDLARLDVKFSRHVVFVDCIDIRFVDQVPWRSLASSELEQKLAKKWDDPAQPRFHTYKGKLAAARSAVCSDDQQTASDVNEDDHHMYSLARERIKPVIMKHQGVYQAAWEKMKIGEQPRAHLSKGGESSILSADPFLQIWVEEITKNWWEDGQ
jgi:Trypsin-like peptidase domain